METAEPVQIFYIESPRLKLIPLTYENLLIYHDYELIANQLGLVPHYIELEEFFQKELADGLNYILPIVKENNANYQWFSFWLIILKSENKSIGGVGIVGLPNEKGETEIGYSIDLHYRQKGYTSEAVECLTNWAFQHPDLQAIIAHTLPDGLISQKVLQKTGFELIGPIVNHDGEVLLWRLKRL